MGPLQGVKVIEFAGIGPGPFCAMLLSDLGADVITIHRAPISPPDDNNPLVERTANIMGRGRRSVAIDLKSPGGRETALALIDSADAVLEGFRPGVMERLGLGPAVCAERNPKLVFGRMTGWGQTGPFAQAAGHDLNYLAVAGVLGHIGRKGEPPAVPLNVVGDFGGGGLLLAFGVVSALLEASHSRRGQVVDASMVEGSALLMTMMYDLLGRGLWNEDRESNMNDGGAPFYGVYEAADGKYVSIAAMEPQFYAKFLNLAAIDPASLPPQWDEPSWPSMRKRFAETFRQKTRAEWTAIFDGTDACFAPVLTMSEALSHPHMTDRNAFVDVGGVSQPAPAPRFSRTPGRAGAPAARPGQHTATVLRDLGMTEQEISKLIASGAVCTDGRN